MQTVMKEKVEKVVEETSPVIENDLTEYVSPVKHMMRWISRKGVTDPTTGAKSVADIDEELGVWVSMGYRLAHVFYIGENPEGYGMLYVLVHD